MANEITISLCTEDRDKLDLVISGLAQVAKLLYGITGKLEESGTPYAVPVAENAPAPPVEAESKAEDKPPFEVAEKPDVNPAEQLATISAMVKTLAAGGKKAEVRDIVKSYAPNVSGIPADKYEEVLAKLEALNG